MKILHLCTYDTGGAANAALRLHQGLLNLGEGSFFASKRITIPGPNRLAVMGEKGDWLVRHSASIEFHLAKLLYPNVRPVLTRGLLGGCGLRAVTDTKPDIVNLHWVDHGMISNSDLTRLNRKKVPIVWTLHDMAPLTGGFGYREAASLPPAPFGPLCCDGARAKASEGIMKSRMHALAGANLTVVAPSEWLAEEARRSPVFAGKRVELIPYGIDTTVFGPVDQTMARAKWNLPIDSRIILFGADTFDDKRKGIHHLKRALAQIKQVPGEDPILLVGFGNDTDLRAIDFPVPVRGLGRLSDSKEIAQLYSAADVFVCPSREDNLPNTAVESLSTGTPIVGFKVGGLIDFVRENETGSLATCFDETDLARALEQVLFASVENRSRMRSLCRETAEARLTSEIQARNYSSLYRELRG